MYILKLISMLTFFFITTLSHVNASSNNKYSKINLLTINLKTDKKICQDLEEYVYSHFIKPSIEENVLGTMAVNCNDNGNIANVVIQLSFFSFDERSSQMLTRIISTIKNDHLFGKSSKFYEIQKVENIRTFSALALSSKHPTKLLKESDLELIDFTSFNSFREYISDDINLLADTSPKHIFEQVSSQLSEEDIRLFKECFHLEANAISFSHYFTFITKDNVKIPYLFGKQMYVKECEASGCYEVLKDNLFSSF